MFSIHFPSDQVISLIEITSSAELVSSWIARPDNHKTGIKDVFV